MYVMAGSWLIASVFIERMNTMSSAILAVYGSNSSFIHIPHWPFCLKRNLEGAIGKRAWVLVMVFVLSSFLDNIAAALIGFGTLLVITGSVVQRLRLLTDVVGRTGTGQFATLPAYADHVLDTSRQSIDDTLAVVQTKIAARHGGAGGRGDLGARPEPARPRLGAGHPPRRRHQRARFRS